jgi:enterochelin esterase-like enzyme
MTRMVGRLALFSLLALLATTASTAQDKQPAPKIPGTEIYPLGPDSQEHPDVPKGRFVQKSLKSKTYPNTDRDVGIFIPPGYDSSKPHRVMVFQDGVNYADRKGGFRVSVVLENLIHKKELPPIVCIYIQPGYQLDSEGKRIDDRNSRIPLRSMQYDTVSPRYAEFLEKEVLPLVAGEFNLTKNPEERCIGGISSGGICAFTVAWHRPDLFRKVISHCGSFTNIRGGHVYPEQIRKTPPKPLRVFLQGGLNDLDNEHGSWPLANQEMAAALKFAKYDYRFEFGVGGHNAAHGGSIMPETLKWIWRPAATTTSSR